MTKGEMTPRERILTALRVEEPDRVPYCEHLIDPPIAMAVAKSSRPLSENETSHLFGRDNIVYWGGLPPFYVEWSVSSEGRRAMGDGLIKSKDDLKMVKFPKLNDDFFKPAEEFVANKEDFAACAILFLGLDPTWHSMGFETFCIALYDDQEFLLELLNMYTDWLAKVGERFCEIGFDFMWAADDIAFKTGTLFSPKSYREILLPMTKKVADKISLPWIYHSDGDLMPIMDDLLSQGMNAIHPLEPGSMDPLFLKEKYGDRICLVGNINIDTLTFGTPEKVDAEVKQRIKELAPGGGYMVSSSNSVTDYCKPENAVAMVEAIRKYGKYPINL
jgi:hypothetical protein